MSNDVIVSFVALIVSILSACFTFFVFFVEARRHKRQSTIDYLDTITTSTYANQAYFGFCRREISNDDYEEMEFIEHTSAILSAYERLAVGTNLDVFDVPVIDRMSGSYVVILYRYFEPYILYLRMKSKTQTRSYEEFEILAKKIISIRGK